MGEEKPKTCGFDIVVIYIYDYNNWLDLIKYLYDGRVYIRCIYPYHQFLYINVYYGILNHIEQYGLDVFRSRCRYSSFLLVEQ